MNLLMKKWLKFLLVPLFFMFIGENLIFAGMYDSADGSAFWIKAMLFLSATIVGFSLYWSSPIKGNKILPILYCIVLILVTKLCVKEFMSSEALFSLIFYGKAVLGTFMYSLGMVLGLFIAIKGRVDENDSNTGKETGEEAI